MVGTIQGISFFSFLFFFFNIFSSFFYIFFIFVLGSCMGTFVASFKYEFTRTPLLRGGLQKLVFTSPSPLSPSLLLSLLFTSLLLIYYSLSLLFSSALFLKPTIQGFVGMWSVVGAVASATAGGFGGAFAKKYKLDLEGQVSFISPFLPSFLSLLSSYSPLFFFDDLKILLPLMDINWVLPGVALGIVLTVSSFLLFSSFILSSFLFPFYLSFLSLFDTFLVIVQQTSTTAME